MKRLNHCWEHITAFDNLLLAWQKARKGKKQRPDVALFSLNLEPELLQLQHELLSQTYQPGEYRLFSIYEHKPRLIAAAPFRDRVVHHALMNIIEPPLDKRFIYDSYACRAGKGVHQAITRYQHWAKRYRYVLKMDIQQYFPSIDHQRLKEKLQHCLKDKPTLQLLDKIIDTSPIVNTENPRRTGIPIGNLTSQFLANLYLNDFDHYLKTHLKLKAYLRYVDDFVVLLDDKNALHDIKQQIQIYLQHQDKLQLHPRKAHITPTRQGLNLLGYRVFPQHIQLYNANGHCFNRKLKRFAKAYAKYRLNWSDFNPSVQSWIGHASHADSFGLREAIFSQVLFQREPTLEPSRVARRFVEQQT